MPEMEQIGVIQRVDEQVRFVGGPIGMASALEDVEQLMHHEGRQVRPAVPTGTIQQHGGRGVTVQGD